MGSPLWFLFAMNSRTEQGNLNFSVAISRSFRDFDHNCVRYLFKVRTVGRLIPPEIVRIVYKILHHEILRFTGEKLSNSSTRKYAAELAPHRPFDASRSCSSTLNVCS